MKNLFFILFFALFLSACSQKDTYPFVPALEYKNLTFGDDGQGIRTFTLTTTFTDGDGDIGYYLDGRPNDPQFDDTSSEYYYNYVLELQIQKNGVWLDSNIRNEVIDYNDTMASDNDTVV